MYRWKLGSMVRISGLYLGLSPLAVRVTTRIITFLVGNPYKPSFPLLLGGGTTQVISYLYMGYIAVK